MRVMGCLQAGDRRQTASYIDVDRVTRASNNRRAPAMSEPCRPLRAAPPPMGLLAGTPTVPQSDRSRLRGFDSQTIFRRRMSNNLIRLRRKKEKFRWPAFPLSCASWLLTRFLLLGSLWVPVAIGGTETLAQQWAPQRLASQQYALQTVPCQDCDAAEGNPLPPLPGIEAYQTADYPLEEDAHSIDAPPEMAVGPGVASGEMVPGGAYAGYEPWFPNRPHILSRTADRLRQRPVFPNRPYLFGGAAWGPAPERPHNFWFNPFAIPQGLGNLLFRGNYPADTGSLGFPYSLVPSHVVDRVPRPYIGHGQPYIQTSHIGRGQPLSGTSWQNRPFSVDGFTGALLSHRLNDDVDQTSGLITGFRLGWDYDHYWGSEFRMGFGNTGVVGSSEKVDVRLADVGVQYYPWGDARWRPYTGLGLGVGSFTFQDGSRSVDDYAVQIPISVGVKYAFKPWWNLRLDVTNFLSLPSSELDFMNNVQLTGAVEYRFGGRRRSYFPYNPSIHLK